KASSSMSGWSSIEAHSPRGVASRIQLSRSSASSSRRKRRRERRAVLGGPAPRRPASPGAGRAPVSSAPVPAPGGAGSARPCAAPAAPPSTAAAESLPTFLRHLAAVGAAWGPMPSPDGARVGFVTTLFGSKQAALIPVSSGYPVQLTDEPGGVLSLRWAPQD